MWLLFSVFGKKSPRCQFIFLSFAWFCFLKKILIKGFESKAERMVELKKLSTVKCTWHLADM